MGGIKRKNDEDSIPRIVKVNSGYDPGSSKNMIQISVGKDEQEYTVGRGRLFDCSGFFRALCNGFIPNKSMEMKYTWEQKMKSSQTLPEEMTTIMGLPDEDPKTFDVYNGFLRDKKIITPPGKEPTDDETKRQKILLYLDAYFLGRKLEDTGFKDAIIAEFKLATDEHVLEPRHFTPGVIKILYQGTTGSDPLRKLILEMFGCLPIKKWGYPIKSYEQAFRTELSQTICKELCAPKPNGG